ncbi:MAG: hypothetical protein IKO22_07060 [Oscillospiraceae bacterium]|nr:hypothetical protein [Oscillospiraceae bacterium]
MKKWFLLLLTLLYSGIRSCVGLPAPDLPEAEPQIPEGYIQKEEYFDPDGFQDYTDYCKYVYSDASAFIEDERWHRVTETELEEVKGFFEDFQKWMELEQRQEEYDFDPACISTEDYVRIHTGERARNPYDNYSVYFFDADSCILYYIHQNI